MSNVRQLVKRMRVLKDFAGIAAGIALGAVAWWFCSYDPGEFRGAAPMRDTGLFSYYRYHAPLGEVPLGVAGLYILKFSGLPSERMGLQLFIPGGTTSDRDLLESLTTKISVEIADARGTVVCSATGIPSAKDRPAKWVLMSSDSDAAFWHEQCLNVEFARHTHYTLRVAISDVDPRSPQVSLKPILEGGGIELS